MSKKPFVTYIDFPFPLSIKWLCGEGFLTFATDVLLFFVGEASASQACQPQNWKAMIGRSDFI